MMDIKREDLFGTNLSATLKVVGEGEIRCRMRLGPELGTHSKALHLTKATEHAWQGQFHCHFRQTEIYLVISGIIAAVMWDGVSAEGYLLAPGDKMVFDPGLWHNIYTTKGAEFVTVQVAPPDCAVEDDREVLSPLPNRILIAMGQLAKKASAMR